MVSKIIIVFLGGGLGAIVREFFMLLIPQTRSDFPLDIFAANVIASFILGLTFGNRRLNAVSDEFLLLVGTGVMGGMSTFSSFVYGAYSEMTSPGHMAVGALYVISSAVVGYLLTLLGITAAKWRHREA
ncbi:fluoride efflux transporter CrcB [Acuticoccus sp. M5D2P5]|uniref:fluoride efflux transporter CrcB n=1 Tax=Acuticoccus kalidii TaxID=2910977 RepID=UPI001F1A2B91|nr:fluoride efflux transporter CrcB [Acuticoccus kalidii]MCF3932042.1 fluoride efflux transporter CrcB [Acuticoccus kalidii]